MTMKHDCLVITPNLGSKVYQVHSNTTVVPTIRYNYTAAYHIMF